MKKYCSFVLATVLLCSLFAFSGCGKASEKMTGGNSSISGSQTDEQKNSESEMFDLFTKDSELPDFKINTTIKETVLYDKDGVKITANSIEFKNNQLCINFTFENNTSKKLSFISGSMGYSCNSINRVMIDDGYINSDVNAGAKAVESMNIDIMSLQLLGITEVAEIEAAFQIEDEEYNSVYTGPMKIVTSASKYDFSKISFINSIQNKSLQDEYEFSVNYVNEEKIFDKASFSVISECLATNSDDEHMLFLELNNSSDSQIDFLINDVSVNGIKIYDGTWSGQVVNSKSKAVETLLIEDVLDKEILEKAGINKISSITLTVSLKDEKNNVIADNSELNITFSSKNNETDLSGTEVYNKNSIKIVSKGFYQSDDEYDNEIHILLLIQNNSASEYKFEIDYDSLTLNSTMVDNLHHSCTVLPSKCAILDIEIQDYDYENIVKGISDIKTATIDLNIKTSNGKNIDTPKITVNA